MSDLNTITSQLWAMANELRGNMDASEYKNYILAFMFYRYLSEHQEQYLVSQNVIDIEKNQTINEAYKEQASGDDLNDYIEDISSALGYAIEPNDTWASLVQKIENSEVIPSDYQTIFVNFDEHAKLNREAEKDFRGVFNDINLGDSRLGSSTNERAKSLNRIVKLVDGVEYRSDDGKDILGEIYEYLIGQFAASAGKKGGEFYTPHGLYHLSEEGTMAIVLPHGVLFRGAAEGVIRKNLIEHRCGNRIYAVIGLPSNLFYGTGIPTIVMVLKKKRSTKDILFIDASNDF